MVNFDGIAKTAMERKILELGLGQMDVSIDLVNKRVVTFYQLPNEEGMEALGLIGFKRRLEERLTGCVSRSGFHMVDLPVEYDGKPALRIELTDQAYLDFMEVERQKLIIESAKSDDKEAGRF